MSRGTPRRTHRYTSKEDAVAVQERMLGVYDNVSNFLFERRQRGRLAGAFRGWRHAARGSVVEELQDELRMLRAQHSEACSLLAGARQRAESLQVPQPSFRSSPQLAAPNRIKRRCSGGGSA